jgi:phage terminase large subunit-like protein
MPARSHVVTATRYARDVVDGRVDACKWVRAACQRQIDDLARQRDPAWPYRFDKAQAERVCRFIELLPHIKGPRAGQTITLEPWQQFVLTTVFGWVKRR